MTLQTADFASLLAAAAPAGIKYTLVAGAKGVAAAWCSLASQDDLLAAAARLKHQGARLSTITIFQPKAPPAPPAPKEGETAAPPPTFFGEQVVSDGKAYEIDYHFDIDGDTLTLVVHVVGSGEIDSLTPLFRNADWPERELMELYNIVVRRHPNPRPLFIDPGIDGAVLERLIPYSTLVNSATTKGLWEKILAQKGK